MKRLAFALVVFACSGAPCRAAGLQLSIQDGKVSIDAQEVTIRQILTEWARVGQTRIVNVERLGGGPITIKLDAVPEKQALDTILRAVPGYIAAPRATFVANASLYDTILIMPTTTAVAAIRPPTPGFPGGVPGAGNITQLRQAPPMVPAMMPEMDPAADQMNDPAIAAAAAAGLLPVPAPMPFPASTSGPIVMPGVVPQSSPLMPGGVPQSSPLTPSTTPAVPTPTNPWNAPVGTAQPSLPLPPAPAQTNPTGRPLPPQPDR
jgi:hypothetical protein